MSTSNNDGNNNNNNNGANEHQRKGPGRRKISIEKIMNEARRQVTFSKRRAGVFKKTSEISTLTGAEAAVVTFSPGNKPHAFGHPSVKAVASRYLDTGIYDRNLQSYSSNALNEETINAEAKTEQERRKKKEKTANRKAHSNPSLDQLNDEQFQLIEGQHHQKLISTVGFMHEIGYGQAKINNAGESSSSANPNLHSATQHYQDPAFPGGSSAASFDNYGYGYNAPPQYPPTGPGFNYADDDEAAPNQGTGFGSNYYPSF